MPVALAVPRQAQRRPSFDEACSCSPRSQLAKSPKPQPLRTRRNSWSSGDVSPAESKSPKHRLKVQVCVRLRPEIAELDCGPDLRTPAPGVTPPPSPGIKVAEAYDGHRTDGRERDPQLAVSQRPWLHVSSEAPKKGKGGAELPGRANCLAYRGNRFKFKHVFPPSSTQLEVTPDPHPDPNPNPDPDPETETETEPEPNLNSNPNPNPNSVRGAMACLVIMAVR